MMSLYVYSKCSTCQKALNFLNRINVNFICKEITENPPTLPELKHMLKFQNGNLKKLFNTSGMLYKEMQLSKKLENLSIDQALILLNQHGMLIKRPFLIGHNFGFTGFNETAWLKKLEYQI